MVLDLEEVLLYLQMTVRPKDEVVTGQLSNSAVCVRSFMIGLCMTARIVAWFTVSKAFEMSTAIENRYSTLNGVWLFETRCCEERLWCRKFFNTLEAGQNSYMGW